jgi:hypothetical protein
VKANRKRQCFSFLETRDAGLMAPEKGPFEPGVMVHACNPNTQEPEAGGSQV